MTANEEICIPSDKCLTCEEAVIEYEWDWEVPILKGCKREERKDYKITAGKRYLMPNGDIYLKNCKVEFDGETMEGFSILITPKGIEEKEDETR